MPSSSPPDATGTAEPSDTDASPVARLRDGIWRLHVPILIGPSRRTLVYLLECDTGFVLIDTGWNWPDGATALFDGIRATGHEPADCTGVLVTHGHPDHHGLSEHVREASGAWIGMHPIEADLVAKGLVGDLDRTLAVLDTAGAPDGLLPQIPLSGDLLPPGATPDRLLSDDDVLDIGGRRIRVLWSPGHSPGHLSFLLEDEGVLATGDHILTRSMTPVAHWGGQDDDPLGDLLGSLRRCRDLPVDLVLPGHEQPFSGLEQRVDELIDEVESHLASVEAVLSGGTASLWDISTALEEAETDSLRGLIRRVMSVGLLSASVQHLTHQGRVHTVAGSPPHRFALVGDQPWTSQEP